MYVTVAPGDTLYSIAREHGTTVQMLLEANPQVGDENLIYVGQQLALPGELPPEGEEVRVISRAQWGAGTRPRLGLTVERTRRTHVFVHHTVTRNPIGNPNVWPSEGAVMAHMRRLQTIRPDLGFDVPYSFVAYPMEDGTLVLGEGRGLDRSGAHTSGHNTAALGIAFAGDFENCAPGPAIEAQLGALGRWLGALRSGQGFHSLGRVVPGNGRLVFGHRDQKQTACPGQHLYSRLHLVRF